MPQRPLTAEPIEAPTGQAAPRPRVSRTGRALDLAGLIVFLAGGGLFARAWLGFQGLREAQPAAAAGAWAAVRVADGYWRLQKIGGALMLTGVAVFVLAWWWAGRRKVV